MKHIKGILAAAAMTMSLATPVLAQQEVGECGVFVFFNNGQGQLGAQAQNVLMEYARNNPGARMVVTGYTDAPGSAASNVALSQSRAQAVAAALAGTNLVAVNGAGEAVRPGTAGPNDPSNRRVEALRQNCEGEVFAMDNAGLALGAGLAALALGAALSGGGGGDGSGTTTSTTGTP